MASITSFPQVANPKDLKIGGVAAIIGVVVLIAILFILTYQIADPAPQDVVVVAETTLEELDLKNLKVETGSSGGGTPSDDPIDKPKQQVQQVLTGKTGKTTTSTGKSNKTNGNDVNNGPSTTQQDDNPFGSGGSGGRNGGGNGPFGGVGSGTGDGDEGAGNGYKNRTRMNNVSLPAYETDDDGDICLMLTVDASGDVVEAKYIKSKSTVTDQRIINDVIAKVRNQVKFNKVQNAPAYQAYYTVRIEAK